MAWSASKMVNKKMIEYWSDKEFERQKKKMKTFKTKIYLKNGQKLTVFLKKITMREIRGVTGGLRLEISWENASPNLPGIFRIDVDEIVAITIEEYHDLQTPPSS